MRDQLVSMAAITRKLRRTIRQQTATVGNLQKTLAAANHNLRQPLQMLMLLQELLARTVVSDRAHELVGRFGQTVDGMTGMLDALLDISRIEGGTVHAAFEPSRIDAVPNGACGPFDRPAIPKDSSTAIEQPAPPARIAAAPSAPRIVAADATTPVVFVVDDDSDVREAIRSMLEDEGRTVQGYADAEAFLDAYRPSAGGCLLIDANLPGLSGIDLLKRLSDAGHRIPAIMITGHGDVPTAVEAMKAGASDFLEKPIRGAELVAGVAQALEQARDSGKLLSRRHDAADHLAGLTRRQTQIMEMVLAGHPSKNIAADLGISRRTVENHRASIMKRTGARSLPALARLAVAAAWHPDGGSLRGRR